MSVDTFWLILTLIAMAGIAAGVLIGVIGLFTRPPDRRASIAFLNPEHLGLLGRIQEPLVLFSLLTLLFHRLVVEG